MTAKKESREYGGRLELVARWAAEPYLSFKDDQMRLYALVCRDLRRIAITGICVYSGVNIPWHTLRGVWG